MKRIFAEFLSFRYEHPAREEPAWAAIVDRWYQLDAFAYGLAQAYTHWKPRLGPPPSLILAVSPEASNQTDFEFARGGGTSPAKFVHTLPNIRCSPLCQVMGWSGRVLCLQKDPSTRVQGLIEAAHAVSEGSGVVWVLSAVRAPAGPDAYEARVTLLSESARPQGGFEITPAEHLRPRQTDLDLQRWLDFSDAPFPLGRNFELRRVKP